MNDDVNNTIVDQNADVIADDTDENSDDTVDSVITAYSDLDAFTTKNNPVRKVSKYGLTPTAKALTKVYKNLFNKPHKPPIQTVFFGAPGTGKSYSVDKKLRKLKIPQERVFRVIFHPDYSYGDFVGSIRPYRENRRIAYRFEEGPMSKALADAFSNPHKEVFVIIEEINRGNAAAIFGDLFQLLDRGENGASRYKIKNENVSSVICRNELLAPFFKSGQIWFPANLNIMCTMNTADQNVFILDTAFKRRFHMEYVKIDYEQLYSDIRLHSYIAETSVFQGTKTLEELFRDTELDPLVQTLKLHGRLRRNWPTFALLVNKTIDIVNKNEGEQISEDKKLGPFYALVDELNSRAMFADKVLYYLKQDVFKYIETYFVGSYQSIYEDYVAGGSDVFALLVPGES